MLKLFSVLFAYLLVKAQANIKSPNIIIILADDLGFDDVSFRGSNEFLTPNIDALAYHGILLDRLYVAPKGAPSRAALLTGRYPIHTNSHQLTSNDEVAWVLPSNITTMANIFQEAGYSTNLVGKWHLGYAKQEYTPTERGFDYHYGFWGSHIDYYQRMRRMQSPNNTNIGIDFRRNLDLECDKRNTYVPDLLTDEAERIISATTQDKPLFFDTCATISAYRQRG